MSTIGVGKQVRIVDPRADREFDVVVEANDTAADINVRTTVLLPTVLLRFAAARLRGGRCCLVVGTPVIQESERVVLLATQIVLPSRTDAAIEPTARLQKRLTRLGREVLGTLFCSGANTEPTFSPRSATVADVRIVQEGRAIPLETQKVIPAATSGSDQVVPELIRTICG